MKYSEALERATRARRRSTTRWTDEQFRAQRDRDLEPATMKVTGVVRATLVCLLVAALLSSGKLVEIAERQPFGTSRDVWLGAAETVDRIANALSLNRPADFIADLRAEDSAARDTDDIDRFIAAAPVTTTTAPGAPIAGPTTGPPPTTVPSRPDQLEVIREIAPDETLGIATFGDSQAEPLGYALINGAATQWSVVLDAQIATGLSRPDVFNWPAEIDARMSGPDPPDVVVMFLGGNDAQDMRRGDEYFVVGSEEWADEYRLRVAATMDLMSDAHVVWVDQPPVSDAAVSDAAGTMNEIFASEAAARPWVDLVSADAIFATPEGGFSPYLTLADGTTIKARTDDGVHLTPDGAEVLADAVEEVIDARFPIS